MKADLRSRVVVLTGATSGVGRATAEALAKHGARIALLARGQEGLAATRDAVQRLGGEAVAIPTDVSDWEQVNRAAELAEQQLGPIDIWINNAMVTIFAPFSKIEPEEYARATNVTYLGTVWGTKAALSRMQTRDQGTIILVGSALAYRGIPLQSAYCGAKHGILGFFESLRTELIHDKSNINLGIVHLPGLNTPQFVHCRSKMAHAAQPVPPMYDPAVAADAILMAIAQKRREVLVGAPTVGTVWLNRLIPAAMDRYLGKTGYSSQQTASPPPHIAHDNLFEPSVGDPGSRGPFTKKTHRHSALLWLDRHHRAVGLAASAAVAVAGVAGFSRLN